MPDRPCRECKADLGRDFVVIHGQTYHSGCVVWSKRKPAYVEFLVELREIYRANRDDPALSSLMGEVTALGQFLRDQHARGPGATREWVNKATVGVRQLIFKLRKIEAHRDMESDVWRWL